MNGKKKKKRNGGPGHKKRLIIPEEQRRQLYVRDLLELVKNCDPEAAIYVQVEDKPPFEVLMQYRKTTFEMGDYTWPAVVLRYTEET